MGRSDQPDELCGLLVLDKAPGPTSMDVVAAVRRRAGGARTGHAGTLDPRATGVLVLAIGRATKALSRFLPLDKRYRTTFDLSAFTDSDDREAPPRVVSVESPPSEEVVREALRCFVGAIDQRPPGYSAVKIDGRRAYDLARRGEAPVLAPRRVHVHALELLRYDWPLLDVDAHVGSGMYVRALARDLGLALGTGGHCAAIQRTAVGPFALTEAHALDDLHRRLAQEDLLNLDASLARLTPG